MREVIVVWAYWERECHAMGYAPRYFADHIASWLTKGWLPIGGRLLDFGSQEFHGATEAIERGLVDFLAGQGLSRDRIAAVRDQGTVGSVYSAIGIEYTAIDVDGQFGSLFFDLNTQAPPAEWIGRFDFVNNEGTTEHLINPINGLHVAHDVLKVGGIARHSVPLTGWRDHGFMYPTPKFYAHLIGANAYEKLEGFIEVAAPVSFDDDSSFSVRSASGTPQICDAWLHLTYRKTRGALFCIPADHLYVPGADAIEQRLRANYTHYAAARPR